MMGKVLWWHHSNRRQIGIGPGMEGWKFKNILFLIYLVVPTVSNMELWVRASCLPERAPPPTMRQWERADICSEHWKNIT
jgi:hypothetical protein